MEITYQPIIDEIKKDNTYKKVIADSFGGIMYNVANRDKYDSFVIVSMWESLPEDVKDSQDGIIKGAMNFLSGK